jgi:hypothetical protein
MDAVRFSLGCIAEKSKIEPQRRGDAERKKLTGIKRMNRAFNNFLLSLFILIFLSVAF